MPFSAENKADADTAWRLISQAAKLEPEAFITWAAENSDNMAALKAAGLK